MNRIADAGLIIAFLDRKDSFHKWACSVLEREAPPFYIAEPIVAEIAAVIGAADDVLRMIERKDLKVGLDLEEEASAVRELIKRYRDRPMDLGDACCVRMSDLLQPALVYTVDRRDFTIYRRSDRKLVPCIFPD
jgi:predicted nucleic acid-binding protein